jgi:hypothetical protein
MVLKRLELFLPLPVEGLVELWIRLPGQLLRELHQAGAFRRQKKSVVGWQVAPREELARIAHLWNIGSPLYRSWAVLWCL